MAAQIFIFFVTFLLTTTFSISSQINYTDKEKIVVTSSFESKNSFISYVTIKGDNYIIKQKKDVEKQVISAVRDALAAYIANDLGIAHLVQIISSEDDIPGKVYKQWPATLHTIAAGTMVRDQEGSKYYDLYLKQRNPDEDLTDRWLTETIIHQITWHKQLPIIIGLDLFISNTDRHRGNLFYDKKTDCFCAIDMDNIYRRDLPALACEKLDLMINVYNKKFTKKEIKALTSVRETLILLSEKYTPEKIIAQLHLFAEQTGHSKSNLIDSDRIAKKIVAHKEMIIKSYASTQVLIKVLGKIIKRFHE